MNLKIILPFFISIFLISSTMGIHSDTTIPYSPKSSCSPAKPVITTSSMNCKRYCCETQSISIQCLPSVKTGEATVTVTIHKIKQIDEMDPGTQCNWQWQACVNTNGKTGSADGDIVEPDWEKTWSTPSDERYVDITLRLEDEDTWPGTDDIADISVVHGNEPFDDSDAAENNNWDAFPRETYVIGTVDRHEFTWSGDYVEQDGEWLVTDGSFDDGNNENGDENDVRVWFKVAVTPYNTPPNDPLDFQYDDPVHIGDAASYSCRASDPDNDEIELRWDFDDDFETDRTCVIQSGDRGSVEWTYTSKGMKTIHVQAWDLINNQPINHSNVVDKTVDVTNNPPPVPNQPQPDNGKTKGKTGETYSYSTNNVTDPDEDPVFYCFTWDDGSDTGWIVDPSASHTWDTPGTYYVKVKALDDPLEDGADTVDGDASNWSPHLTVSIQNPEPPHTPDEPQGPGGGAIGTTYDFTTSAADDNDDSIRYGWDWDDGSSVEWTDYYPADETVTLSHSWDTPESYAIRVKAEDVDGQSNWSTPHMITIQENQPPQTPDPPEGPTHGYVGEDLGPYTAVTTDPDDHNIFYWFDWGDGTTSGWLGPKPSGDPYDQAYHTWNQYGTYDVTVKAIDDPDGDGDHSDGIETSFSTSLTVKIDPQQLTADAGGPYTSYKNEPIQFTGDAAGGVTPYHYHWEFGDGTTSSEQNPSHAYSERNTYTATLKVIDRRGKTAFDETLVTIENQAPSKPGINGPSSGKINMEYTYTATGTDPDEDQLYYFFDWGDETNSGWQGPFSSGDTCEASHTWTTKGDYEIRVKTKDHYDETESEWSTLVVSMPLSHSQQSISQVTRAEKIMLETSSFSSSPLSRCFR